MQTGKWRKSEDKIGISIYWITLTGDWWGTGPWLIPRKQLDGKGRNREISKRKVGSSRITRIVGLSRTGHART